MRALAWHGKGDARFETVADPIVEFFAQRKSFQYEVAAEVKAL